MYSASDRRYDNYVSYQENYKLLDKSLSQLLVLVEYPLGVYTGGNWL